MSEVLSLEVSSWFSRGWNTFNKSPRQIIGGAVILSFFCLIPILLTRLIHRGFLVSLLGMLVQFVVIPVLATGWRFMCLRLVRGENAKASDVFCAFPRFRTVWLTHFLVCLIMLGGFILLIIPGMIWAIKYCLSSLAVMDRQLSPGEAIRFSGKITDGYKGKLFCVGVISLLLSLLAHPLFYALRHLEHNLAPILITVGIVLHLAHVLVITPWIAATFAAAYDSLAHRKEGSGVKEISSEE